MGEPNKSVWLEEWSSSGSTLTFRGPTHDHVLVADLEKRRLEFEALAPERARLAAAAPAMVRALLKVGWEGVDGWDSDQACPACGGWVCTGQRHKDGCEIDAALSEAGFPDQVSRDEARRLLAGVST